ncbi:MAG TPA: glycosyltransferase family 2 protein [Puia sp.]|jgi:glycosyltransferase involved in cell wall biosynthesis
MEKLSVVIISFNEEKNIDRCLRSVKGIADEIVVLDSFSSDRTGAIVKEFGGHFYQQAFTGYGAQKNAASALATHDHILFLDADEFLSEALAGQILREKDGGFPYDGYSMNRLNNYCGRWIRHGSWYPDKKLRILHRQKGAWSLDIVHESLIPDTGARISHLPGDLLHYAYSSIEEHTEKNNRYSTLSALLLYGKGKRTRRSRILLNPFWAFIQSYLLRSGFLDGFFGLTIAIQIAHLTFLKHVKLYQLQKSK